MRLSKNKAAGQPWSRWTCRNDVRGLRKLRYLGEIVQKRVWIPPSVSFRVALLPKSLLYVGRYFQETKAFEDHSKTLSILAAERKVVVIADQDNSFGHSIHFRNYGCRVADMVHDTARHHDIKG